MPLSYSFATDEGGGGISFITGGFFRVTFCSALSASFPSVVD